MTSDDQWDLASQVHAMVFDFNPSQNRVWPTVSVQTVGEAKDPGTITINLATIDSNTDGAFQSWLEIHNDLKDRYESATGHPIRTIIRVIDSDQPRTLAGYIGTVRIGETDRLYLDRITSSNVKKMRIGTIQKTSKESLWEELQRLERENGRLRVQTKERIHNYFMNLIYIIYTNNIK